MKKFLSLMLVLVMVLALVACGGGGTSSTPSAPATPGTSTPGTSTPGTPSTPSTPSTPDAPTGDALATFTFGENGEAKHYDGATNPGLADGASFTAGNYTIVLSGVSKTYAEARDAMGNSCLKLGTGSAVATFSFDVAADVNKVVIEIAAYKANTAKVVVNGVEYDISACASNNGEYYTIVVDTTATKTVSLATVSGATRAMINTIAFYG